MVLPPPPTIGQHKKIFISRKNATQRKITNESELTTILEKHGFAIIDPGNYSIIEQLQLFREADIVVGLHGMGIANFLICKYPKALVEIFTSSWLRVSYFRTAQFKSCAYGAYVIENTNNFNDITIEVDEFLEYLCKFGSEMGVKTI